MRPELGIRVLHSTEQPLFSVDKDGNQLQFLDQLWEFLHRNELRICSLPSCSVILICVRMRISCGEVFWRIFNGTEIGGKEWCDSVIMDGPESCSCLL